MPTLFSGGASFSPGTIIQVGNETVPGGFLECDGSAISRSAYAALFSVLGVIHGQGNGTTTFNLPDMRGKFVRGWAHGAATDPDKATRTAAATGGATGDHVGSVQVDAFKAHTHTSTLGVNDNAGLNFARTTDYGYTSNPSNSTGGNETRPVNVNSMFCIKY